MGSDFFLNLKRSAKLPTPLRKTQLTIPNVTEYRNTYNILVDFIKNKLNVYNFCRTVSRIQRNQIPQ